VLVRDWSFERRAIATLLCQSEQRPFFLTTGRVRCHDSVEPQTPF
jgi:hypothetical protein